MSIPLMKYILPPLLTSDFDGRKKAGMKKTLKGVAYIRWMEAQAKRRAEIIALRVKGETLDQIGRKYKISRQRVWAIAERGE